MQKEDIIKNKQVVLNALAKHTKRLRGKQSQFMFCSENDISCSIISTIERALKDPQLTTIVKLAEAFNMKTWQFVKLIDEELPEGFSLIEK